MTRRDTLALLVRHGVLDAESAAAEADAAPAQHRPWYVSAMLGAAGWLASLCAFFFTALLFEPDSAASVATVGVVMLAAAFGLYAASAGRDNTFLDQLALACSLGGQGFIVWASIDATDSAVMTAAIVSIMEVGILLGFPNRFTKFLAAFLACVAWALTVRFALWGEGRLGDGYTAVPLGPALFAWAVIWLPIAAGARALIRHEARWMATDARRIVRPALTGMLVALALATWVSEPFSTMTFWSPDGAVPTNWLSIWPLLGVGLALYAAVCAYLLRDKPLIGIAIAGALLHLVQFYYLIGVTLVAKSLIMVGLGVALLVAARLLDARGAAALKAPRTGEST